MLLPSFIFLLNLKFTSSFELKDVSEKYKKLYQSSIVHIKQAFKTTHNLASEYTSLLKETSHKHGSNLLKNVRNKLIRTKQTIHEFVKSKLQRDDVVMEKEKPSLLTEDIFNENENIMKEEEEGDNKIDLENDDIDIGDGFKELFEMLKKMGIDHKQFEGDENEQMENAEELSGSEEIDSKEYNEKMECSGNEDMDIKQEL